MSSRHPSGSTSRLSSELIPAALGLLLIAAAVVQFAVPSAAALPERHHAKPTAKQQAKQDDEDDSDTSQQPHPLPAAYAAVMAHPIFAPDRAPPPAENDDAGNLNGVQVLGTAIAGNAAAALVRDTDGSFKRVKMGEEIAGWKLVAIQPKELVFDRNGERRTLDLDTARLKTQGAGGPGGTTKPAFGANGAIPGATTTTTDDSDDDDDQ